MKAFCSQTTGGYRGQGRLQNTIHFDGWKGYDGLVDLDYKNIIGFNTTS
jgi:hypothetical protein